MAISKLGVALLSSLFTYLACYGYFRFWPSNVPFVVVDDGPPQQKIPKELEQFLKAGSINSCDEWHKAAIQARCLCTDEKGSPSTVKAKNDDSNNREAVSFNFTASELENLPNVEIRYRNEAENTERCPLISGRRILINYASDCCSLSQQLNCETGVTVGGFDVCVSFSEKSLDEEFKQRNEKNFNSPQAPQSRFWLWKPYIIMKALLTMHEDDILMYADSGSHFIDNFDLGPNCLLAERGGDIAVFTSEHQEKKYSKADAFLLMGCLEQEECYEKTQLTASFFLFRKTFRSLQFVSQWLTYAQDYRILSNDPSELRPELPDFEGHRNDQSIVSILAKKWKIEHWPDPSQWGNFSDYNRNLRKLPSFNNRLNRTFINHTRFKE